MNKKNNKKLLARIGAVLACVLLVGVLAIPAFADYNPSGSIGSYPYPNQPGVSSGNNGVANPNSPTINLNYKSLFLNEYDISEASYSPLAYLLNSNQWLGFSSQPFLYEFTPAYVGSLIEYDCPVTFSSIDTLGTSLCIVDRVSGDVEYLMSGHWEIQYTTYADTRTILLKFKEYGIENEFYDAITIRITYDLDTLVVLANSISGLGIYGSYTDYRIACATNSAEAMVMEYLYSMDLCTFTVNVDFNSFIEYVNLGYYEGYYPGYTNGYTEGRSEWHERGMDEGYAAGYLSGYLDGYDNGYDDGYDDGEVTLNGYQAGYDAAVRDIDSGKFGANLLGQAFSAPMRALESFKIVELPGGTDVTIGGLLSAVIGLTLFIAFLKVFAGG